MKLVTTSLAGAISSRASIVNSAGEAVIPRGDAQQIGDEKRSEQNDTSGVKKRADSAAICDRVERKAVEHKRGVPRELRCRRSMR